MQTSLSVPISDWRVVRITLADIAEAGQVGALKAASSRAIVGAGGDVAARVAHLRKIELRFLRLRRVNISWVSASVVNHFHHAGTAEFILLDPYFHPGVPGANDQVLHSESA